MERSDLNQARLESLGRVAGGVAHDFNNILQAIMGHTTIALDRLERGGDVAAVERHLHEVLHGAERAADLTRQLLLFARHSGGPRVSVNVNEVVTDLERLFRRVLGEDIVLQVLLDSLVARVACDRGELEQVVMNLVLNARDAMPSGGRLSVAVAQLDAGHEVERDLGPGPWVLLSVKDTGRGMDAHTLAHAFDPFFTTKEPDGGTGLGLSTVYGVVTGLGGAVRLVSEVGEGTTVLVYLPADPEGERAEPARRRAPLRGGHELVLLAEDDPDVRALLAQILADLGYHVVAADRPETALSAIAGLDRPVDLLLTDVVMPGGTGPDLAAKLLADRPGLPVLYLSGYVERARQAGVPADAVLLAKPVDPVELGRRVRALLDGDR